MTLQLPAIHIFFARDMEPSPSFLQRHFSQKRHISLLIPPKIRSRSRANSSVSRPDTPISSIPPSLSHSPTNSTQSSCNTPECLRNLYQVIPIVAPYLQARDLLSLMSVSPICRDKLAWDAFDSHLRGNSWDLDALVRRVQPRKDHKSRIWLSLAKSSIRRAQILTLYDQLPEQTTVELPVLNKQTKYSVERLLRTLLDITTEHDNRNFTRVESLASSRGLSFIQLVSRIPAYSWKLRYIKTFIIAAYVHGQTSYIKDENDISALAETLCFDGDESSPLLSATHVNFIYIFGCCTETKSPLYPITSMDYDPPHLSLSHGHGIKMPGVRQAVDRFKTSRLRLKGFYRKVSGEISSMNVDVEPLGLASKLPLPFLDRSLITMHATVSDDKSSWKMDGTINQDTGTGILKSGVTYKLSVTPWGIVGEKMHNENCRHLGYFVLHWA